MECISIGNYFIDFISGTVYDTIEKRELNWKNKGGYIMDNINGRFVCIHRFIYETYHNIRIPYKMEINHINQIRDDNRISNLEMFTKTQNKQYSSVYKNNKLGVKGVIFHKAAQKFRAQITFNKCIIHIGLFDNAQDARDSYNRYARYFNTFHDARFKMS